MPRRWYLVLGRAPSKKKRRSPLDIQAEYPARRWQFALKAARRLREKGYEDVVVREVTVTHEQS